VIGALRGFFLEGRVQAPAERAEEPRVGANAADFAANRVELGPGEGALREHERFHGVQVRNEAVDTTRAELVEPVRADDARADRDESDAPALQRRAVSEHPLEHFGLGAEALVALAPTLG